MSPSRLETLPPELLLHILTHFDTRSLLSFSLTNAYLHHLSITALTTLHLAIFPKRLHATLSFLDSPDFIQNDGDHFVAVVLNPPSPPRSRTSSPPRPRRLRKASTSEITPKERRDSLITSSTTRALSILTPYSASLRNLSLLLWAPTEPLISHLATSAPNLRSLNLHFSHHTHRDGALPAFYFDSTPLASDIWDSLAGIGTGQSTLRLRGLEHLSIERAGITSTQLKALVASNPRLRELHLKCVRGVDAEFVEWLGAEADLGRSRLEVLRIDQCQELSLALAMDMDEGDDDEENWGGFEWIERLAWNGLRELAVVGCDGVGERLLRRINRSRWRLGKLDINVMDGRKHGRGNGEVNGLEGLGTSALLEVDPDCL